MLITLLAVTKAYDRFCIAGMTDEGKWVRPIPDDPSSRFWPRERLIKEEVGFVRCGDVWEIDGKVPHKFQYQNHREDFVVSKRSYKGHLGNEELLDLLRNNVENEEDFNNTVNANRRSLCLLRAKKVITSITCWEGEREKPKVTFESFEFDINNPKTKYHDYIVKDCKWSGLILKRTIIPLVTEVYFCIGLATPTPYDGVEYPQVIGLHTNPEINWPTEYPD